MRKPLKVGIHEDLIPWCEKKGISAQHLSIFMRCWCSNIKYLRKLGKKSHRRNLDGEKIEEITIEHKQDAQNKKDWVCFTGKEIASFTGVAEKSIGRARQSLIKKGIIKAENRNPRKNDHALSYKLL